MNENKVDWSGNEAGQKYQKNYIMGLWKFSDRVPMEQLIAVAEKALENPKYLQIYIRKCSKDQYAIGFTYDYSHQEPKEGQNKEYMDPVMDKLKREFGNDFVGWDIASPVWIIK
jgi:hypothetical protein